VRSFIFGRIRVNEEDKDKSKDELINELNELRQRLADLEASAAEWKEIEQALLETEQKFRSIAETARDAIIMIDHRGKISYWNPAAEEIFGYTIQEANGKELTVIIPNRYHEDFSKGFDSFRNTGKGPAIGRTFESEAIKKDRTEFPVELSISAVQIEGQWHALAIARDITDRRLVEKVLRESLEKYQLMLNNEKDVIILVDLEEKRFLEVNEAVEGLYGYTREEFLRLRVPDISAEPEEVEDLRINEVINQSRGENPLFLHKKKDGTIFPVEISACAFMWKNRKTFCAVLRDITGRGSTE
jgi:PAS domain S-box-containing protein